MGYLRQEAAWRKRVEEREKKEVVERSLDAKKMKKRTEQSKTNRKSTEETQRAI